MRKGEEIKDAVLVLLDDFVAVAVARVAAEFGGSCECGVGENENRGGWQLDFTGAIQQTTGIIRDGGLKHARKSGER